LFIAPFKQIKNIFFLALFTLNSAQALATTSVQDISFNKKNQLEISLSQKTDFKVFTLSNPDRLVIDIALAKLSSPNPKINFPSFVTSHRNTTNQHSLRLVFDLTQKITVEKSSFDKEGKNIIINLSGIKNEEPESQIFILKKVEEFDYEQETLAKYVAKKNPKNITKTKTNILKKIPIIVIDSGHGGKDPGTIGNFARSKEKNITLSYARELAKQLKNTGRYKVYLTRDEDIFIPLKKRVDIARRKNADLFISLHANSIGDEGVSGFSIYTLSEKSSDKQAELLAQKENRADIISGINFSNASQDIMKTLIDLSQRETMNGASRFSNTVIKSMRQLGVKNLENTHRFAGFAVLTAPDMISVLIELGYLSNQKEEKLLNSLTYKRKIALGLVMAIDEYFAKNKS
jgi:N-acetylmuramoyl-L-alanine amidase